MARWVLALDQGTTSSRSILFDHEARVIAVAQREFQQYFPSSGWVEHDANEIWATQSQTLLEALDSAGASDADIAAVGITNQRETSVLWDRNTGEPISRAIVWQDRRTADACQALKAAGFETEVMQRTGLLLDPYFSGTKLAWMLEHIPDARRRAEKGELCFGTMDSWLAWKLSGGRLHITDITNAATSSNAMGMYLRFVDVCCEGGNDLSVRTIPRGVMSRFATGLCGVSSFSTTEN